MSDDLQTIDSPETTVLDNEETFEIGTWYWVKDDDEPDWLGCVVHIGSNYVKIEGLPTKEGRWRQSVRIHFDNFDKRCTREPQHEEVIQKQIEMFRGNVSKLLDEVKQLTAKLGLIPAGTLNEAPDGGTSSALVVAHGTKNIEGYKQDLIRAKEKTLPELFKQVEEENRYMAAWMEMALIPMQAEAAQLKKKTESISDRIFTVELYAGLIENLEQIREGAPAPIDEKIHVFQRRHYMDEECLLDYKAGGMEFKNLQAFDRWLLKKKNRKRLLPTPKCVVAFRVRRNTKEREAKRLSDFISFSHLRERDETTFLYIRNGESYYRLATGIDFGKKLFPDTEHAALLSGGKLYLKNKDEVVSEREYLAEVADQKRRKAEYKRKLKAWKQLSEDEQSVTNRPHYWDSSAKYVLVSPDTVYYDDAMAKVASAMRDHNRVAVVLQGLLDRSPAFHPHPPWRLWTPEGFLSALTLVYDDTRALTDGEKPDFEAYRDQLNRSITKGTHVVGQQTLWMRAEAEKENRRQDNDWRIRYPSNYTYYQPDGDPGPGDVAQVVSVRGDKCKFTWLRERQRRKFINRWRGIQDETKIEAHFRCSVSEVLNVDAYTPGDFVQFYVDPRTRADYLKWAPLLLTAEDWHAKRRKEAKAKAKKTKK